MKISLFKTFYNGRPGGIRIHTSAFNPTRVFKTRAYYLISPLGVKLSAARNLHPVYQCHKLEFYYIN